MDEIVHFLLCLPFALVGIALMLRTPIPFPNDRRVKYNHLLGSWVLLVGSFAAVSHEPWSTVLGFAIGSLIWAGLVWVLYRARPYIPFRRSADKGAWGFEMLIAFVLVGMLFYPFMD